jgi:hypothetical protein
VTRELVEFRFIKPLQDKLVGAAELRIGTKHKIIEATLACQNGDGFACLIEAAHLLKQPTRQVKWKVVYIGNEDNSGPVLLRKKAAEGADQEAAGVAGIDCRIQLGHRHPDQLANRFLARDFVMAG